MNTYTTSTGERIKESVLDRKIKNAKNFLKAQLIQDGVPRSYCAGCGHNVYDYPIDWSHIISIADCKNYGMADLAYTPENIERECRRCHNIWENGPQEGREKQKNYQRKIDFVKKHSEEIFERRYNKGAA
jgi:hypothetical protein